MLHIHRSERADALVAALADLLAAPPADPFAREVVAVPTRGMERWLTQQLSHRLGTGGGSQDGICAAIDFPFPGRLVGDALALGSSVDPERDPWDVERLVWPLMELVSELADEPWLSPLSRHLAAHEGRRYTRVRHLAGLYDRYALDRPEMILSWLEGHGEGWQPELWRMVRARIGVPSGPERLAEADRRLRADPDLVPLPERLACFGLTRLAATHVQLLFALGAHREIHLMLLHPSPASWARIAALGRPASPRRRDDQSGEFVHHRLLASWGRDSRELQRRLSLDAMPEDGRYHPPTPRNPAGLLGILQADLRDDRAAPGPPFDSRERDARRALDPQDASLRIHACHGRTRQVAVLREAILHRMAADPTLEPRDIIVLCPDVEEFAPLITAAFGAAESAEGELRVRLADRSLRQTNPLLAIAARLLELIGARLTASEVLDLIDAPPVRRRFGLSDDDISRLRGWVVESQIHWGLDAEHRDGWKLSSVDAGTWMRGLRRLLLSVTMAESTTNLFGGTLPAADIGSDEIALVGALAELIDRLGAAIAALTGPQSVGAWVQALVEAVDAIATVPAADAWQRQELVSVLEAVAADAGGRADLHLGVGEARALLAERLRGRPTRANFRTGHLTVCTLHPMRSIPHRVVCLLGLDDGAFPRHAPRDGDDLLALDPHLGDRDPRAEDRQLLLDALMAAEEALVITYSGADERTNTPLPPAVPVGELLDVIDATVRPADEPDAVPVRDQILIRHPLQPFDPRNFEPGRLEAHAPWSGVAWSFDPAALAAARSLTTAGPSTPAPFLGEPLSAAAEDDAVALSDLIAFVERPARAFLRQRIGVSVARWDDEVNDALPVEFDGLGRYGVGQRLLEAVLAGAEWSAAIEAEIARGTLPPGELGRPIVRDAYRIAGEIAARARIFAASEPRTFETNIVLDGGRRLTGTVSGVRDNVLLTVAYSRLNPRQRLAAWTRLLALTAAHPDVGWEAVTVGRALGRDATVAIARIPPLAGDASARARAATQELATLLSLRSEGLRRPFACPAKTGDAFMAAQADGTDPLAAARREWESGWSRDHGWIDREDSEPEHQLIYDGALPARLGEDAPRLWTPLRARERLEVA